MRPSDDLGRDIHSESGDPTSNPGGYQATITAVNGDQVSVVVPGYAARHDFAGLSYSAPDGPPQVGDGCVAVFTDDRDPFVLVGGAGAQTLEPLRFIRGHVNSDGTVARGVGFTASRTSAGVYVVTFISAYADQPTPVLGTGGTLAAPGIRLVTTTASSFTCNTFVTTTGTLTDCSFRFFVAGP